MTKKEKEIALNAWYSCMIAMGSIPKDEHLYFERRKRFLKKHGIVDTSKIMLTCDDEYQDIKDKYFSLAINGYYEDDDSRKKYE